MSFAFSATHGYSILSDERYDITSFFANRNIRLKFFWLAYYWINVDVDVFTAIVRADIYVSCRWTKIGGRGENKKDDQYFNKLFHE